MVSKLPLPSSAAFVMGRKGNWLSNSPAPAPAKGRVGLWLGVGIPTASAHTPRPHSRTEISFNCPRSGSVSRNTPIPCFGGIQDAALAHKRGRLETLGFKWRSLGTFCCYWQKVTRRRQQKREISWTAESYLHKYSPPLRSQCSRRLWRSVPHGRASGFFNCPRSGSVRRNTPLPCFGGIQDATLAHKRGSLEPLGFKWHSLGTFCCYWQKVTRRRQQKKRRIMTAESTNGIFDRLFAWEPISA